MSVLSLHKSEARMHLLCILIWLVFVFISPVGKSYFIGHKIRISLMLSIVQGAK